MTHLKEADRIKIEHYLNEGYSFRKIATECINLNNCKRLIESSKAKMCMIYCPDYQIKTLINASTKNLVTSVIFDISNLL